MTWFYKPPELTDRFQGNASVSMIPKGNKYVKKLVSY